jgi:hypothetical protein
LVVGEAVDVWGWAWADGGVAAVELSADGVSDLIGVALEPPTGRGWQRFTATWRPEHRGEHALRSRVQAADCRSQPPAGARNAIHSVSIRVV